MAFSISAARAICRYTSSSAPLGKLVGGSLLQRSGLLNSSLVPRSSLFLTSTSKARIYGPEEFEDRKDEVHHWCNERYVAVALIPIIPSALIYPNIVLDSALCACMVLHTHWRLSGVIQDYIHIKPLYTFLKYLIIAFSVFSLGSLSYFNYTDVGFSRAARLIYTQL